MFNLLISKCSKLKKKTGITRANITRKKCFYVLEMNFEVFRLIFNIIFILFKTLNEKNILINYKRILFFRKK